MNTTMFVIASILGAAIAGRMSERIGSKRIFLLGLGIFASATVLAALAPTMYILILARTIEGFAGGILLSMAYVLIRQDRKSTRLNSSHVAISYAVFCLKKK